MHAEFARLKEEAKSIEHGAYFPQGKNVDGCPYTAFASVEFLIAAMEIFGGMETIREEIAAIMKTNPKADPDCGNWWLWMVLHKFEVARESPYDESATKPSAD